MNNKYCYMTLMTDKKYLPCIIRQSQRMKYLKTKYPFIVMIPKNNEYLKNELKKNNIKYKEINVYSYTTSPPRLHHTINKFQIFNYIKFKKICFLDADIILNTNIDHIFKEFDKYKYVFFKRNENKIPKHVGYCFLITPQKNFFNSTILKYHNTYIHDEYFIDNFIKKNKIISFPLDTIKYFKTSIPFFHFSDPYNLWNCNKIFFPFYNYIFYESSFKEFNLALNKIPQLFYNKKLFS